MLQVVSYFEDNTDFQYTKFSTPFQLPRRYFKLPNNRDCTAVSSRTRAGQQASNIAPASLFDNIFSKILLQTIDIDVTASPMPPLIEALLNGGITRWFDFVFTIDEDEIYQLTITSGHSTIPLYKYSIKTLLILRKLIDKFVYDDDVDHLDSAKAKHAVPI